jgi:hypothetical protein
MWNRAPKRSMIDPHGQILVIFIAQSLNHCAQEGAIV